MSRKNNVNPDHYKVAGRERQGENIVQSVQRQAFAQQQAHVERWQAKQHDDRSPVGSHRESRDRAPRSCASAEAGASRGQAESEGPTGGEGHRREGDQQGAGPG